MLGRKKADPSTLKDALPDEFDVHAALLGETRRYRRREKVALAFCLTCFVLFLVSALQPPTVIVKDNVGTPSRPAVLRGGDAPPLRAIDVETFFAYAVRLRWGWDSATVLADLEEFNLLLAPKMRAAFQAHVNGYERRERDSLVGVPRLPRVAEWMKAQIRNDVALPRSAVECTLGEDEAWYCRGFGAIETAPMFGDLNVAQSARREVEFRAKIHAAPYTDRLVWGMIIAFADCLDVTEDSKR